MVVDGEEERGLTDMSRLLQTDSGGRASQWPQSRRYLNDSNEDSRHSDTADGGLYVMKQYFNTMSFERIFNSAEESLSN